MMLFQKFLYHLYLVFSVKSTIMIKKIRLNGKQVETSSRFTYTKYKVQRTIFNPSILDLQQKIIKKIAESYKQFCSIYVQLLRLQIWKKYHF